MLGLRKFILAMLASISAGLLCWGGHITGGQWVTAQSIILGLYKAADAYNRRTDAAAKP